MSMFNDTSWGSKDNKKECESSTRLVSLFSKRFGAGRWSLLGLGSEIKWSPTDNSRLGGEWDKVAELMWSNSEKADTQFSEPRVRCLEEHSKAKEVENYQYTSVPMEIRLKLFLAQSFLQISTVSTEQFQMCVMNTVLVKQELWDLFWQDNLTHSSSQPKDWSWHPGFRLKFLQKKIYCKSTKNEWKGFHNKIVWSRFVLMQDSWKQLKSDSISWQNTLTSSYNLQSQWRVVRICHHETKRHLNWKVGSEGTPTLGPYWKLQPVVCKVIMELRSELCLWTKTILTRGSELLMAWISWSRTWKTTSRKPQKCSSKNMR